MYKMSVEHLAIPEYMRSLKTTEIVPVGPQSQPEKALTGQDGAIRAAKVVTTAVD